MKREIIPKAQLDEVKNNHELWWAKKLKRPLCGALVKCRKPSCGDPGVELLAQNNVHLMTPVDKILDKVEYELSQYEFIGDAFPNINLDCFGPGVLAALIGGELYNDGGKSNIWFRGGKKRDIAEAEFKLDRDNKYFKYISELYVKAAERFEGQVVFGMLDLGGILDILATFFPGDDLFLELYDRPADVKKQIDKVALIWHNVFNELHALHKSHINGYTDWSKVLSMRPSYILQSDFSYMLSAEMFDEFVLPELSASCKKLGRSIYHLDGPGEIKHLPSLLGIKELSAVQWISGTWEKPSHDDKWTNLYKSIVDADKLIQIVWPGYDAFESLKKIAGRDGIEPGRCQMGMVPFEASARDFAVNEIKNIHKGVK